MPLANGFPDPREAQAFARYHLLLARRPRVSRNAGTPASSLTSSARPRSERIPLDARWTAMRARRHPAHCSRRREDDARRWPALEQGASPGRLLGPLGTRGSRREPRARLSAWAGVSAWRNCCRSRRPSGMPGNYVVIHLRCADRCAANPRSGTARPARTRSLGQPTTARSGSTGTSFNSWRTGARRPAGPSRWCIYRPYPDDARYRGSYAPMARSYDGQPQSDHGRRHWHVRGMPRERRR